MSPLAPSATIQLLGTTEFGNLLDCCHSVCHSPTSGNAESETVSVNHSSASANFGQSCGIASHSITYLTFSTNLAWLGKCVFRPIVTAHSEKGVTGDSEVVTGDSDLIVTDLGRRRNHRSRCRNRRSRSNRNGLCGQRGNHPCHGYPRALCAERRDAGGADCHAQHQGAVTAQVRLRALA